MIVHKKKTSELNQSIALLTARQQNKTHIEFNYHKIKPLIKLKSK